MHSTIHKILTRHKQQKSGLICNLCGKQFPCAHYKILTPRKNIEDQELKELYEIEDNNIIKLRRLTSILE